jgi:hypothetical protein
MTLGEPSQTLESSRRPPELTCYNSCDSPWGRHTLRKHEAPQQPVELHPAGVLVEPGILVSTVHEHEFTMPGYIGFQSQGVPIQWRNVRIKPE